MIPKPIIFTKQGTRTTMMTKVLAKTGHDVIILEEAFSSVFRTRIKKALKKTHPYQKTLSRGGLKFLNSGVFIASRYPYRVLETLHYDECAVADCLAGKGVILIELDHPSGKKLQIAASHIQAQVSPKAKAVRKAQFEDITSILRKHRVSGIAQIVTGDLNVNALDTDADSEFNQALEILKMENGPLSGDIGQTGGYKVGCYKVSPDKHRSWLDHVLIDSNESGATVLERRVLPFMSKFKNKECPLSDHYGLEAVIKL